MATRIQLRRGTAANWRAINPVLAIGEPGFETDTGILRIGNGQTIFTSLTPIFTLGGIELKQNEVISNISNSTMSAIQQIEDAGEETISNITELGETYTQSALSIASEMSNIKSGVAMLFGNIDGGNASSVYIKSDSIDCGDSTAKYNLDDVISGGNAETSKIPLLNLEVNISNLNNFQTKLDLLTNRILALETLINGGRA